MSSSNPSFLRKFSKLLPRCLFLLFAAFDVGIFALQSQSSVLRWGFPCLLNESMQQDDFAFMHKKRFGRCVLAACYELPRFRLPRDRPGACRAASEIARS